MGKMGQKSVIYDKIIDISRNIDVVENGDKLRLGIDEGSQFPRSLSKSCGQLFCCNRYKMPSYCRFLGNTSGIVSFQSEIGKKNVWGSTREVDSRGLVRNRTVSFLSWNRYKFVIFLGKNTTSENQPR